MDRTVLQLLLCLQVFLLITAFTPQTSQPSPDLAEGGKMNRQHDKHGFNCIRRRRCGGVHLTSQREGNKTPQNPRPKYRPGDRSVIMLP